MERSTEEKILWRKVGGGSLRFGGKLIKPEQTFEAAASEIPKAFRDVIVAVNRSINWKAEEKKAPAPPLEIVKPSYTVVPRGKSLSLFDVVDGQGKVINEKSLKKEVAEKLVADLLR